MKDPIAILRDKYRFPIDELVGDGARHTSPIRCTQHAGSFEWTKEQYLAAIGELLEAPDRIHDWNNPHMARVVYRYLVQLLIENHIAHLDENIENTYLKAINKAQKYIENHSWVFAEPEIEVKLDAAGNPAAKKGDKKVRAKEVYESQIKDKGLSRKQAIEILVKEVGLTAGAASTYYHNLKTGIY